MYMETTLIVSSQGQVVIPSKARELLGIKAGSQLRLKVTKGKIPTATLTPKPENWVEFYAGLGKGLYGNVDKYVKKQKNNWNR